MRQLVISKEYNAAMLAEAMCKLRAFNYAPSDRLLAAGPFHGDRLHLMSRPNPDSRSLAQLSDEVGQRTSADLLRCLSGQGGRASEPDGQEDSLAVLANVRMGSRRLQPQCCQSAQGSATPEPIPLEAAQASTPKQARRRTSGATRTSLATTTGRCGMKATGNAIANRLSLRPPQRESLEILDRVCELLPLSKDRMRRRRSRPFKPSFPSVTDFERDFPSLCFALQPASARRG